MAQLQLTPLVGLPLANGWSQVTTNQEQNLVCALAVSGKNANNSGRELSNLLLNSKIKAEQDVHHLMLDLLRISRDNDNQIQVAMTAQLDNKYILAAFQAKIILKRKGKIGTILQAQTEPGLIIGQAQAQDLLILLTRQAQQFEPKLLKLLKQPTGNTTNSPESSPDRIATQLVTKVHGVDDSAQTAIALLYHPDQPSQALRPAKQQQTSTQKQAAQVKKDSQTQVDESNSKPVTISAAKKNTTKSAVNYKPLKQSAETEVDSGQFEPQPYPDKKNSANKQPSLGLSDWLQSGQNFAQNQLKKILTVSQTIGEKLGHQISKMGRMLKILRAVPQASQRLINRSSSQQTDIYLTPNNKRKIARITLVVLMVLALAIGSWFFYQQQITQKKQRVHAEIQPGVTALQQAQVESNLHLAREGVKASIKLLTAKFKKYEDDGLSRQIIERYLQQAQQYYQDISGQIELNQLEIFFDLRQVNPTFSTSQAAANNQALFFLDQGKQTVVQLNVADQTTRVLDLQVAAQIAEAELEIEPEQIQITDLAANSEQLLLLGRGIYSYQLPDWPPENEGGGQPATQAAKTTLSEPALTETSTPLVQIKQEGDSDRSATLIEYFNNYLYVFNPERRNIYRYIMQEASLSDPIGWLTNKQGLEFEAIVDLSINGFIWLSDNKGQVLKLSKGGPVTNFQLSGIDPALKGSLRLTSHSDLERIFVLVADQNRVVILNQEGQFIKEITSSSLAASQQILVAPDHKALFVISGSLIYQLPLNDNP